MLKRILFIGSILLAFSTVFGQTKEQMDQLKNLTPDQIAILKQQSEAQSQTGTNNDKSNKSTLSLPGAMGANGLPTNSRQKTVIPQLDIDFARDTTILNLTFEDYYKRRVQNLRDSVKVFGRELFSQKDLTFAPSLNLPTPTNYILSSGDELNISVWGAAEENYKVMVSPDGFANISGIGMVQVGGMTIKSAESRIKSRLLERIEGVGDGSVFVNISLGSIRSIKVNIAGEAKVPGTYTLPSLATLFNALYVAGGVSEIGSVRDIKLYRHNKLIATLDVYDYILKGKLEIDLRLEDNDLIVVEPYINLVKILGGVKRPMIYEMKSSETLKTLISFTGGFSGNAYRESVNVSRSSNGKDLELYTVAKPGFEYFFMNDKDSVQVGDVTPTYANRVAVSGAVWRPGDYELSDKINSVKTLVEAAQGLRENAFQGRAQLIRTNNDQTQELIALNLKNVLEGADEDVRLWKNDSLIVSCIDSLRQMRTLSIYGEVNDTLTFEYVEGMTLSDILLKANGLKESASLARVDIARRIVNPDAIQPMAKIAETFSFKVSGDLTLTPNSMAFKLMPFDQVFVRRSPGYNEQRLVNVEGEVVFTGQFAITNTSVKLSDMIAIVGGVTPDANIKGASLRRKLTESDIERQRSLQAMQQSGKATSKDTVLIEELQVGDYYTVGIDLEHAINVPGGVADLQLQEGDKLMVPTFINTVKISGGVYYPNTVTFDPAKKLKDYINMGGGYTQRARRVPFVILQSGMVSKATDRKGVIQPGCEIVVPQKPEKRAMSAGEWLSIGNSVVSMAAMVSSLFR